MNRASCGLPGANAYLESMVLTVRSLASAYQHPFHSFGSNTGTIGFPRVPVLVPARRREAKQKAMAAKFKLKLQKK